jgi:signal transduction histidine kinase
VRWILDTTTPIRRGDGTLYRLGGVARDITAQRQADAARRRLEAELAQAHRMEAIGALAGGIAHNFNNALAVIIGNVDLARVAGLDNRPLLEECLDMVTTAGARAQALVQQLLTFARQNHAPLRPEHLGPLVESAAEHLRPALPSQVRLVIRVDPDTPAVFADATQIRQVVENLVTNAVQAIDERDGCIEVALDRFDARVQSVQTEPDMVVGPYARLSVTDSGPGMDEVTKRRLFEPFFTTAEPANTVGLGLSVVHGIIKRHGGTIRVWSEPGLGTRMDLYFPARSLADPPQP